MTDAHSGLIILALNSGSSSLKFGLYRVSASRTEALLSGEAQSIGEEGGRFHAQDSQANSLLTEAVSIPTQRDAISRIGQVLAGCKLPAPVAVGHRIVHGGPNLRQHCLIDVGAAATRRCNRLRAAAYVVSFVGHPLRARTFFGDSAGSMFRHHISCWDARGRARASDPEGIATGGYPALWISWSFVRIDRASACRRFAGSLDHRPSRQWRQCYRRQRG